MKTGFQRALKAREAAVVDACRMLNVHRSSLSRWRRGVQGLSVETAQALQRELRAAGVEVDLDYFFEPLTDSVDQSAEVSRDAA